MRLSKTTQVSVSMYNRVFAKNKVQSKKLDITLTKVDHSIDSDNRIDGYISVIKNALDDKILACVHDPIMVDLLEPKAGNTVHNRLLELKTTVTRPTLIGDTVPAETKNSFLILLFPNSSDVTLEGLATWIQDWTDSQYEVTISDGSMTVHV